MKKISITLIIATLALILFSPGFALTVDQAITPAYVREHPQEFSVEVRMNQDGLLAFTVARMLSEPKYLVARLSIRDAGKTIAESHTPLFAKKDENTFYFSVSPEYLEESTFEIGESTVKDGVPLPGTKNFRFQIKEFVPEALLRSALKK